MRRVPSVATLRALALASAFAWGASAAWPALASAATPVLDAIEALESQRDARCYSSASRFEDFLYGTPLASDARAAHVQVQKELAERIWQAASQIAGASDLEADDVLTAGAGLLALESGGADGVRLALPGIEVSELRARQYASIAYSLRAILAVEQDRLIALDTSLQPLTPETLEALRQILDAASLAALALADRDARQRSLPEIEVPALQAAWGQLLPDGVVGAAAAGDAGVPLSPEARARSLALLDELVAGKSAAYRVYNELEEDEAIKLLVFNISRFYARRPLSPLRRDRRALVAHFEGQLDRYAGALIAQADQLAAERGEPLIRAGSAAAAVQQLTPHRIDDFEDVYVFERLEPTEQVTLEAFDCDSFRDFGLHWQSLARAAHAATSTARLPDPFAAEILAEAISQYAVLLLRVAGVLAGDDPQTVRLLPPDLDAAEQAIRERARRHHATPERVVPASPIVSAAAGPAEAGAYFRDVTADVGLAFVHRSAPWLAEFRAKRLQTPPTFSGGGVAAEDVDGDGDVDLLFVGGGGNALLLNDGQGHFVDRTDWSGLDWRRPDGTPGEARQPLIADFDNDGLQDVFMSYANDDHRLYRNLGAGRFQDVTGSAGLGGSGLVGGPATTFDFDGDGLLDLYLGYFGDYLSGAVPSFDRENHTALPNRLFRNRGDLGFEDVTQGSGSDDTGWTQAVSHVDFDRDGRQDLIVANDYGRNAFLRNLGAGHFENRAPALGITKAYHSMNVGVADLNDDDYPDIYISNLAMLVKDDKYVFPDVNTPHHLDLRAMAGMLIKESDQLYLSQLVAGQLASYMPSSDVERGPTSTGWAWDAEFLDVDHDGDDDLYLVNGTNDFNVFSMVYRRTAGEGPKREYLLDHRRESNVLFLNEGGRLRNISPGSGADLAVNSRSTAYLDFDGDGDLDVALNNFHAPARFLRNEAEKRGGFLALRLVGDPTRGSNRDAIGARIRVTTSEGRRIRRELQGGSGYLSMNSRLLHVGIGAAATADVEIVWPNGERQTLTGLTAGSTSVVHQGEPRDDALTPPSRQRPGNEGGPA